MCVCVCVCVCMCVCVCVYVYIKASGDFRYLKEAVWNYSTMCTTTLCFLL